MPHHVPPKTLLVAYDFSHASSVAASYADRVAKQLGADLVLCHVVPAMPDYDELAEFEPKGERLPSLQKMTDTWFRRVERDLHRFADTLEDYDTKVDISLGDPVEQLVRAAREEGADAIVCGATGRGPLSRLLLGSTAAKLVRLSPVPVWVIRWEQHGPDEDDERD